VKHDIGKTGGSLFGICVLVRGGVKRDALVANKMVGGGIGRGSSAICIGMGGLGSSSVGGVGGSKWPGRIELVPVACVARSVVVKPSLMTLLESCRPFGHDSVRGGTVAAWIIGCPRAAKLVAICLAVQ